MTDAPYPLAAMCLPGLEGFVERELELLGIPRTPQLPETSARPTPGVVRFVGDAEVILRSNLGLGTATRVAIEAGSFRCRSLGELARKTARLPWRRWLRADESVAIQARARRSRLYHTGAIAERVGQGIAEALGPTPPPDVPGETVDEDETLPSVLARFDNDHCTLWLDTSGEPLHRRGYRRATAKAPLRPDLARAMVMASGFDGEGPFLDPFCGSGTLAIEAALWAQRRPPGGERAFAWSRLELAAQACEADIRGALRQSARCAPGPIAASDRDAGAVQAARANAERAGVADSISFDGRPMADAEWLRGAPVAERGHVVTNPPFGLRVRGGAGLVHLHQALGARLSELGPGWSLTILAHDPRLARRTGISLTRAFVATHGGTRVHALTGRAHS